MVFYLIAVWLTIQLRQAFEQHAGGSVAKKQDNEKRVPQDPPSALARNTQQALIFATPRILTIGLGLNWKPSTLIRRVKEALSSPVEQQLYLHVAGSCHIHPESMAKLLGIFRGSDELCESDLEQRQVGENLFTSRFDEIIDKVEAALSLVNKATDNADYPMSMEQAASLVEIYGEDAEYAFGIIVDNVGEVGERLGMYTTSERMIVGVAVRALIESHKSDRNPRGCPTALTIEDMFPVRSNAKRGSL